VYSPLSSSEEKSDVEAGTDDHDNDNSVSAGELDDEKPGEEDLTTLPHNQEEELQEALSEFDLPSGPEFTLAEALFQLPMMLWTFQGRSWDMDLSLYTSLASVASTDARLLTKWRIAVCQISPDSSGLGGSSSSNMPG
jgi:hypothetical protein